MRNRTRDQFLNPQRTREPGPGKAAEVDRAERTDVATQGLGVVGAVDAVGTNPPAARIPRAKFIGHPCSGEADEIRPDPHPRPPGRRTALLTPVIPDLPDFRNSTLIWGILRMG